MRNLSVMEQKKVTGGYYCVKVYKYGDGNYLRKYYFTDENKAKEEVKYWNDQVDSVTGMHIYHAIYITIK